MQTAPKVNKALIKIVIKTLANVFFTFVPPFIIIYIKTTDVLFIA